MPGSGATGDGIFEIDTAALTRPRAGAIGRTSVILKQSALALAGLIGSILWFFGVMMVAIRLSEGGSGEAVVAIVGLVIGAVPMLLFILFFIRFRHRHFSGVGGMVSAADLGEAELGRIVPHLGVTLRTVVDDVAALSRRLGPVPGRVTDADPGKRWKARSLQIGLVATAVLAVVLYVASGSMLAVLPLLAAIAGFPVVLRQSRQAVQPTLEAARANDPRKPVLLLRSFADDGIEMNHRFATRLGDVEQTRRFEQQLAGMLEAFGPLIAIGQPGEALPQIGAARGYRSDAEWQAEVVRWIGEAVFVALIAGQTEWVRWELGRVLDMDRSNQLLVLLPPGMETGAPRWTNLLAALAGTRWHPSLAALDTGGLLLVLLRPDGTVLALRRGGKAPPYADDYQVAIAVALYEMFCTQPAAPR
jgi:hypothetical protein